MTESFTSYAQNFEDVMLWRALKHVQHGFYIDIGAQHPLVDSVSLAFYEHGWQGIHVEPTPTFAQLLREARGDETVIQAAVGRNPAIQTFFEIEGTGLSTIDREIAEIHKLAGFKVNEISVPVLTLANIFETCPDREIHWLKIDVEGAEDIVLRSWRPSKARPWIVVVESTFPLTQRQTHSSWEPVLRKYGYAAVYFDGLNRYYVSKAHPELKSAFLVPPNVFDGFSLNGTASATFHKVIEARYKEDVSTIRTEMEAARQLSIAEVERLNLNLVSREGAYSEKVDELRLELEAALRGSVQREREVTAQLLSIQQQAAQDGLVLERESKARELELTQQWQIAHKELARAQQAQIQREQEWAAQLLAVQQQAAQDRAEQERNHTEHERTLQRLHTEREDVFTEKLQHVQLEMRRVEQNLVEHASTLNKEIATLQNEKQALDHNQQLLAQRHHAELKTKVDENQRLTETVAAQEAQFKIETQAERQTSLLLRQSLAEMQKSLEQTHASLTWRLTAPLRAVAQRLWNSDKPAVALNHEAGVSPIFPMAGDLVTDAKSKSIDSHIGQLQTELMVSADIPRPLVPKTSSARTLADLLNLDGEQFIEGAYYTLLNRPPDPTGRMFYLDRLLSGVAKMQILDEISSSTEAQALGVTLSGLQSAIKRHRRARRPFLGLLARTLNGVAGNSAAEKRMRSHEQKSLLLGEQLALRLDQGLLRLHKLIVEQGEQLLAAMPRPLTETGSLAAKVAANVETKKSPTLANGSARSTTSLTEKTSAIVDVDCNVMPVQIGTVYYFVDHTIQCPINTGMQRVVRKLGRYLYESGVSIKFVKWDAGLQALVLVNHNDLNHLSKWHGPELNVESMRSYPQAEHAPVLIDPHKSDGQQWLVVPEVTHVTYHQTPVTLDIITTANRLGLKTAFVYYDAIPLRLTEYKEAAEKHEMYMQHLLLANLIVPISSRSAVELTDFFDIHQMCRTNKPRIETICLPGESQLSKRIYEHGEFIADENFILCVGSIEPRKNQTSLVKAFENFCAANPGTKWRLVLAGNLRGDVAAEINASIARDSRISHVQNLSDEALDKLYRTCSFTVFPSVEEGFGLPIIESLWYAKPCICANFGAMVEVAVDGGCYLIDTNKLGDLEGAIAHLAKTPELRQRLAKEASTRVLSTWGNYSNRVMELLQEESDPLRELAYVFYWIDNTCVNLNNSGIQRVVRQLARALISLGIKLIPFKWDGFGNRPYPPTMEELVHLAKWSGPLAETWTEWVDPRQVAEKSWILIPELTHGTVANVKKYAADVGLRCSAIFYDAIPWKMRDIFPAAFGENHSRYMEDLLQFDKVYPISNFSRSELVEFALSTQTRSNSLDHRIEACVLPSEFIGVSQGTIMAPKSSSTIRILSVISMEPRKNPLGLLAAFAEASNEVRSRIKLTLVARRIEAFADLAAEVDSKISRLDNVTWESDVDDTSLKALYSQSDFTIFPSLEEGFGLPILESLWYARPCICHNEGAMLEVADGGGCVSIDLKDKRAFVNAIVRLADDSDFRVALATAALQRPVKRWCDYAQELAKSMATDRSVSVKKSARTVSDELGMYRELVNLDKRPLLSICISTFNRAAWLAVGLRNLQNLIPIPTDDIEILVCDNTSTDHTADVVQPYLSRRDFKYVRNKTNVGMLGNLRVTAHHARGRYIWILGDDDLALPGSVDKILSIIRTNQELALIYLNYSYTRETDASAVKDLDKFFSQATMLIESSQDVVAPVRKIAANNENLFTAIYCQVFRRDHALRAYSQDTSGRPFSTMRTSIPTTYYVLNFMMDEPAYWVGTPQLVVNFNVSWNNYAALQILERVPEAQDLAERMGASPTGMDRWRENLIPGVVHYFTEMFENDVNSNAEFFSPVRVVARMKHLAAFQARVPALRAVYERAHRAGHPAARMSAVKLFAASSPIISQEST